MHTHVDIVTRSKKGKVIAKAAYNARDRLRDDYYGEIQNYTQIKDLVFSKIFLPEHVPKKYANREYLWNEVEKIEKNKNAQLARNLLFALPRELSEEDRIHLLCEFVEENFTSKGMIADCNIHNKMASDNQEQPHAHILLTLREIDKEGNWQPKSRKEYILDENGEKIKLKSGNYKSRKINTNDWNERDKAKQWRESFAKKANEYLARNHIQKRIDPRTFEEQGREELPQIHLGTSSYQMEKKGIRTERGNRNRMILAINREFRKWKEELKRLTNWINTFSKNLFEAYQEYKEEKKEEYENKAELFNLYEYISIYYEFQGEKRRELNPYAKNKKGLADLKRFSKARAYLLSNNLQTIADLQGKINELQSKNKSIHQEIKDKTKQIQNLHQCLSLVDTIKENKAIYQAWKNKTLFKDSFYKTHQDEIKEYQKAKETIERLTGTSSVKVKDWKKEIQNLEQEICSLHQQSQRIKDEYQDINHIKYAVKIVNEDYGIDLSIEIDKAIKRGEKPSVIAQIKKYKAQQEAYEKKKEKTKEYYIHHRKEER